MVVLVLLDARAGHAQVLQREASLRPVRQHWPGCSRGSP